jgi:hypothetical protein
MDAPQRVSDASPLTFGILGNGKCTRDKGGFARARLYCAPTTTATDCDDEWSVALPTAVGVGFSVTGQGFTTFRTENRAIQAFSLEKSG